MPEVRNYSWLQHSEQKSENECYEDLANAIIEQAVADMANAVYKKELAERQIYEADKTITECSQFLCGDQIKDLTEIRSEILVDAAIKQGHYLAWKHDRGCSRCKFAKNKKCIHGKGGAANWYEWSKGNKTCLYTSNKFRRNLPKVEQMQDAF